MADTINTQLERIEQAKADIIAVLTAKGVTVPADAKISDLAAYINSLSNAIDLTKGEIING